MKNLWAAVALPMMVVGPIAAGETEGGKKYALLVGVSEFEKTKLRNLPGARNDVEKLRDALIAGGFDSSHVTLMTNRETGVNKPTAANIRAAVRDLLKKTHEDDTVVVAFAGHGFQLKGGGGHFFAAADTLLDKAESMVALHTIYRDLAEAKPRRKLLMVDACRVDPFTDTADRKQLADKVEKGLKVDLPTGGNLVALFSCSESQASIEDRDLNHGVFFYYVIRGLRGDAVDKTGVVSVDSLTAFVRPQVEKHVREKWKDKQEPMLKTAGEIGLFALIRPGDSPKYQALLGEAQKLTASGKKADAIAKLTEAIAENPRGAAAYLKRGQLHRDQKMFNEALDDFDQVLTLEPGNAEAIGDRGWTSFAAGDKNEAVRQLKRAIALRPADEDLTRMLGYLYIVQDKFDDAVNVYSRIIDANPGLAQAYHDRATAYFNMKKYEDAMKDYDRAVDLDPHSIRFRDDRSDLAGIMNNFSVAFKDAERAKEVTQFGAPANDVGEQIAVRTHIYEGDYYRGRGEFDKANQSYKAAGTLVERMQGAQVEQFERKLENNPLFRQNMERLYNRFEDAAQRGNIIQANAAFNEMIGKLPPAMKAEARREWQEYQKELREEQRQERGGIFGPKPQPGGRPGGKGRP